MVEVRAAGSMPDVPDAPGVYVMTCAAMGRTAHRLGQVLYIGISNSLRRRVAYALASPGKSAPHDVQAPLMSFQEAGGVAHLFYCPLEREMAPRALEDALFTEFKRRTGTLPPWNKGGPRKAPPEPAMTALATEILDRLNVR